VQHLVHWDDVESERTDGAAVTDLAAAAGTRGTRCERIRVDPGGRWTLEPREDGERISFVLAGSGGLDDAPVRAGDCAVHASGSQALVAGDEGLDVIGFETRSRRPLPPRTQAAVVHVEDAESESWAAGSDMAATTTFLGRTAGSVAAGLNVDVVAEGMLNTAPHCHSAEEEIFLVLDGEGTLLLGDDEHPVRGGHVLARPPGSRFTYAFRGGRPGLTVLLYGTREPNDITYYPRSGIVALSGVGVRVRVENLDPDEIF
jgi:uncharacterized cupin superfamily protein